jgi:hypothetical protein
LSVVSERHVLLILIICLKLKTLKIFSEFADMLALLITLKIKFSDFLYPSNIEEEIQDEEAGV